MSITISPIDVFKMQDDSLKSIISNPNGFHDETVLYAYGEMVSRKIEFTGEDLMSIMDFILSKGWDDIETELKKLLSISGHHSYDSFKKSKLGVSTEKFSLDKQQVIQTPESIPTVSEENFVSSESVQSVSERVPDQQVAGKLTDVIIEISRSGEDFHQFMRAILWQVVSSILYFVLLGIVSEVSSRRSFAEISGFLAAVYGIVYFVFFVRMIIFLNKGIKRLRNIDHLNQN